MIDPAVSRRAPVTIGIDIALSNHRRLADYLGSQPLTGRCLECIYFDAIINAHDVALVSETSNVLDAQLSPGKLIVIMEGGINLSFLANTDAICGVLKRDEPLASVAQCLDVVLRDGLWLSSDIRIHIRNCIARCLAPVPLDSAIPSLSQAEKEVLRLVIRGLTDAEIASARSISVRTVKFHLANLRRKSGCTNRTQLIVQALNSTTCALRIPEVQTPLS